MLRLDAVIVTHALAVVLTLPVHGGEPYWLIIGGQRIQVQLEKIEPDVPPPPSDRDNDGIPDTEDECPDDATNKCNEPPPPDPDPLPPIEGLEYFDALKDHPATVFADSLYHPENPKWYVDNRRGGSSSDLFNPFVSADEVLQMMRMDLPEDSSKLGPGKGIQVSFPPLGEDVGSVVIKYRAMISDEVATDVKSNYKYVNLTYTSADKRGSGNIGIEWRIHPGRDSAGLPILRTDTRSYADWQGNEDRGKDTLRGPIEGYLYDRHTGPDSMWPYKGPDEPPKSYVLKPDTIYVVTNEVTWQDGKVAYRQWLEDGKSKPCLIQAASDDPSKGFLLGRTGVAIDGVYFELDQSSGVHGFDEIKQRSVYFDDLIVMTGVKGEETLGQLTEGGE